MIFLVKNPVMIYLVKSRVMIYLEDDISCEESCEVMRVTLYLVKSSSDDLVNPDDISDPVMRYLVKRRYLVQ